MARICYRSLDSWVTKATGIIGQRGSLADRQNNVIAHQQIIFEDAVGGDIGFGPDGLIKNENRNSEYGRCEGGYSDKKLREAVKNTPTGEYSFFSGDNNCQDWIDRVLDKNNNRQSEFQTSKPVAVRIAVAQFAKLLVIRIRDFMTILPILHRTLSPLSQIEIERFTKQRHKNYHHKF